jgi:hypothetical protein
VEPTTTAGIFFQASVVLSSLFLVPRLFHFLCAPFLRLLYEPRIEGWHYVTMLMDPQDEVEWLKIGLFNRADRAGTLLPRLVPNEVTNCLQHFGSC